MAGCSATPTSPTDGPATPLALALDPARWQTISEPSPYRLVSDGAALAFEFPESGSIHYLFTDTPTPQLRGTLDVTVRVVTVGPVVFDSLDPVTATCSIPPSTRPLIWANGNGSGDFDRWWSNKVAFVLADGGTTLSVPLQPGEWSSVNGRIGDADAETRYGFSKAILNVTRLGLTFGGGCSFGHGIKIRGGAAQFVLAGFAVR